MRDWINRTDGKTTYTTDGTIVYCQPCQQQVPSKRFSQLKQHDETGKHKSNFEHFVRPSGSVDVDELIASTKKVFSKAPSRVAKFRELCDLPLPPRPIITRWATWLRAALYYSEHLVPGPVGKVMQEKCGKSAWFCGENMFKCICHQM
uniref:Uncharacterized protein n=1 Tax=Globodera rostochiensis TaxID=31243 RepID=A0A914HYL0_GLORO